MSLLRPEALARLRLWAEPAASALAVGLGLWLLWRGAALGEWLLLPAGLLLATAGGGLLVGALRRLRLRAAAPGEGVVVIDEARIAYFGPVAGGVVDLPRLTSVGIDAEAWTFADEDGTRLRIPRGALGAERLPDALSALPGFDLAAVAAALATPGTPVWRRSGSGARRLVPARTSAPPDRSR